MIYCLYSSIQYYQTFEYLLKYKIIYAWAFPSKDYVFTPRTSVDFEISRRLIKHLNII